MILEKGTTLNKLLHNTVFGYTIYTIGSDTITSD